MSATVKINSALTANEGKTYDSSGKKLVDFFFLVGASRNNPNISKTFRESLDHDYTNTLRTVLWARDVRGGAGERKVARDLILELEKTNVDDAKRLVNRLPELGRWDDVIHIGSKASTDELRSFAYDMVSSAIHSGNGLAAKWAPRKGNVARELRNYMNLSPKKYRKLLVKNTKVVEQDMCAKNWGNINYPHVPSVAQARYKKAFNRNDSQRYQDYLNSVKSGQSKINASAVFPHDVIRGAIYDRQFDWSAAEVQWNALPNYLTDGEGILPVCDVSGSMVAPVSGSVTAMDVSISLGMYISERQNGAFKNVMATFSTTPTLMKIDDKTLNDRFMRVVKAPWGMTTNIEGIFKLILDLAVQNNVPQSDMPKYILVLSDMEFNACVQGQSAYETLKTRYKNAGYKIPKTIFWNLNGRAGNVPVSFKDKNTALVSGFSPAILTSVLSAKSLNPLNIVLDTLKDSRYDY